MNIMDAKRQTEPDGQPHISSEDDVWVPSSCSLCYGSCSIIAHRVDGVITKIEGNPDSIVGLGRLCGKGVSGIMTHYDPHRLTVPLRRTNPEKGIGIDPKWEEISWEEALTEVAGHLKRVRDDDPRKLMLARTTTMTSSRLPFAAFQSAFGAINWTAAGGGLHCGNATHLISGIMHASWSMLPDFQYCNYSILFGASKGHSAGHAATANMKMAADARMRGMKMVVVDPFCNFAAAKASEWVPIRVGTDAALVLAMCNVMVNDLGIYDAHYLKAKTNASYLIGADLRYLRDAESDKPMVWDETAGRAVPFDGTDADNMALEGAHSVDGATYQPAFVLIREHLKIYTPEMAEEISTVPAANIRRLATEFGTEARIGSTIVIDGVEIPYRPVAAVAFRGAQGHRNSSNNMLAVCLLNQLVGAADMVGGSLGFNPACHGYPETGRLRYTPYADKDGLMIAGGWMLGHGPYPVNDPKKPEYIGLQDLFTMSMVTVFQSSTDAEEIWDKLDLPYRIDMFLNIGTNPMMSVGNKDATAEALKKYKFIVSFDLFFTETSEFADILLPDCGYLQSVDSRSNFPFIYSHPAGMGEWCWPVRQPVVPPIGEQRLFVDVLLDLAERAGFGPDINASFNASMDLQGKNRLESDKRYTYAEICDHDLKDKFGQDKGLDWFKENGVVKWPKKPEEVYWRHFVDVRVPIYWEWMTDNWEKLTAITGPAGIDVPKEFYSPLPDWLPCLSHECEAEDFDFYAFYYRDVIHSNSLTMENAWLDETAQMDPFSYNIAINQEVGKQKGFSSGDLVWVENEGGRKVKGRLRLTEAIHPEGLGIGACAGHWASQMPVAKGKGVFFNDLLELDLEHSSPADLTLDICVKVKISKVNEAG